LAAIQTVLVERGPADAVVYDIGPFALEVVLYALGTGLAHSIPGLVERDLAVDVTTQFLDLLVVVVLVILQLLDS
jgi:hypothetical protein